MKLVIQRVLRASVLVDGKLHSAIEKGALVLVGLEKGDEEAKLDGVVQKLIHLRLFEGESGKPDLSLLETDFQLLLVSQFTLCARLDKGRRPDFNDAMAPDLAHDLYQKLALKLSQAGMRVSLGVFGAYMQVHLEGDGPFTLVWQV